jgi:hypothetical protein
VSAQPLSEEEIGELCDFIRAYAIDAASRDNALGIYYRLLADLRAAREEIKDAHDSEDAADQRAGYAHCACMVDRPDDVCGVHSPAVSKITADLSALRTRLEEAEGLLRTGLDLFAEDAEVVQPGTDAYAWAYTSELFLTAFGARGAAERPSDG